MARPVNVALVGAGGYWAGRILPNLAGLKEVRLRALVTRKPRPEVLRSLAPGGDVVATHRLDRVLDSGAVDAVIVATPAATHYRIALAAIQAGKHVFLEKPPALAFRQVRELAAAARRAGSVVVVDHIYLFAEPVRIMERMIREGAIGRPLHFFSHRSNFGLFRNDSDTLSDLGYHDIYLIRTLLRGERPVSATCSATCSFRRGLASASSFSIRFQGGLGADVFLSWLSPTKERLVVVAGSEGILEFRGDRELLLHDKRVLVDGRRFSPREGKTRILFASPDANPLESVLSHFAACVRRGRPSPECSLEEAAEVVRWQERLRLSARSGRSVRMQSPAVTR